jgi:hypothetical protein
MRISLVLILLLTLVGLDQHRLAPSCEIAVLSIAAATLVFNWRGPKGKAPKPSAARGALTAKDVGPVMAFVGGAMMYAADAPAIQESVQTRLAAERARRPNHASVALARCDEEGLVEVSLYREGDFKDAAWRGVVGRMPEAYVPKTPAWTFEAYQRAEPVVNALMEAALDDA